MNRFILAIALSYSTFFFAQNKTLPTDAIQVSKDNFSNHLDDLPVIKNTIDLKSVTAANSSQFFVYNTNSKYNDIYLLHNGNYYLSNATLLLENHWRGTKIDSFNPYGTNDLGSAVALGFVNLLLDKKLHFKFSK